MLSLISTSILLLSFTREISAQSLPVCGQACFEGTPGNASSPGDASLCPLAVGGFNPFLTSSCLCFEPETFTNAPFTFCFTCSQQTTGNFDTVCGTNQVTQSCPGQNDIITTTCNANSDINTVLGALCADGKPTDSVEGIDKVAAFVVPELAAGALALLTTGCASIAIGQAVSDIVSDLCNVWDVAGCLISPSSSATSGTPASTGAGKAGSTSAGKAGSTSVGKAGSTSAGKTAASSGGAASPTTGNANASTCATNTSVSTNTAPSSSSTSPAPTTSTASSASLPLSDPQNMPYAMSFAVASIWMLVL